MDLSFCQSENGFSQFVLCYGKNRKEVNKRQQEQTIFPMRTIRVEDCPDDVTVEILPIIHIGHQSEWVEAQIFGRSIDACA